VRRGELPDGDGSASARGFKRTHRTPTTTEVTSDMATTENRTAHIETIHLSLYTVPGATVDARVLAEAWERAQAAVAKTMAEYGWPVRVEQER
jgi:hypothetical protein